MWNATSWQGGWCSRTTASLSSTVSNRWRVSIYLQQLRPDAGWSLAVLFVFVLFVVLVLQSYLSKHLSIWKWTSDCHPFSRYLQALVLRQKLFGWGSSRRTDDSSTCWACFEKGCLCNVPPKPKNVGKPAMQNNTVSCYVLETAQHFLGRRLQGCSFLRIC